MKEFEVVYLPIGVPTFHLESAEEQFRASRRMLKRICGQVTAPDNMLLSIELLAAFMDQTDPSLIILQNITFANAAYTQEVLRRFPDVPILLWGLREPVIDGGRLRLNSLTGSYSAANTIRQYRKEPLDYVFGSPSEDKVIRKITAAIGAAELKYSLKTLKLAQIGHTPQGFGFGRAGDLEMLRTFGVRLESIEARELIDKARSYTEEECLPYLEAAESRTVGLENTPEKNRIDFAHLFKAYSDYTRENNIGALASRCWPDFFTSYGTPVCTVISILNDIGVAATCHEATLNSLKGKKHYRPKGIN